VILSQHIVVRQLDKARTQGFQELFEAGFRFGKQANRVPLLRGMQFGYMIIPVIIGADPETALVKYVSALPRRRWSLFEYPVFVDSRNCQTIRFRGTSVWGAFFFSEIQGVVDKYISVGLPSKMDAGAR
jgi:hypothetical protein